MDSALHKAFDKENCLADVHVSGTEILVSEAEFVELASTIHLILYINLISCP